MVNKNETEISPPPDNDPGPMENGIIQELGTLPPKSIINEEALARILQRHPATVKRAVARGELPPPIRFLGAPAWTVEVILRHLDKLLEVAAKEAEEKFRKFPELRH